MIQSAAAQEPHVGRGRRLWAAFAVGALALVGGVAAGPAAQAASTGEISGTLTAADGGTALADAEVVAVTADGEWPSTSSTSDSGEFTLSHLPAGESYFVEVFPSGTEHVQGFAVSDDSAYTLQRSTSGATTFSPGTTGVAISVPTGGSIRGSVTGYKPSGDDDYYEPAIDVVSVSDGEQIMSVPVDASGAFVVDRLYRDEQVYLEVEGGAGYLDGWVHVSAGNASLVGDQDDATVFGVGTTGLLVPLTKALHLTGRVTTPTGGLLDDVTVWLYSVTGSGDDTDTRYEAQTSFDGSDGSFDFDRLAPGTQYALEISLGDETYEDGWVVIGSKGVTFSEDVADATRIVAGGPSVTVALTATPSISGTVVDAQGKPVAGVRVGAATIDVDGYWYSDATATTSSTGAFILSGLSAATGYRLHVEPSSGTYAQGWATASGVVSDSAAATIVHTGAAGAKVVLSAGTALTGKLVHSDGTPAAGVDVYAQLAGSANEVYDNDPATASDGSFRISGIPAGSKLNVLVSADGFDGEPRVTAGSSGYVVDLDGTAAFATFTTGSTVTISLPPVAPISGTLKASDGGTVTSGTVYLTERRADGTWRNLAYTSVDDSGSFEFPWARQGGAYRIEASYLSGDDGDTEYVGGYVHESGSAYGTVDFWSDATMIGAGLSVTVQVDRAATITGSFVGAHPDESWTIGLFRQDPAGAWTILSSLISWQPHADRSFTIDGLRPGTSYRLRVGGTQAGWVQASGPQYVVTGNASKASSIAAGATSVAIVTGAPASVAGAVRDASGASLDDFSFPVQAFDAFDPAHGLAAEGQASSSPSQPGYTWPNLAPGSYLFGANRQSGQSLYAPGYYSASSPNHWTTSSAAATPLTLTAGQVATGVDMTVATCATVSGKVSGIPAGYSVVVYVLNEKDPDLVTRTSGFLTAPQEGALAYTVTGLAPGSYDVFVDAYAFRSGKSVTAYYGGGTTVPATPRLTIPSCAAVSGIDVAAGATVPTITSVTGPAITGTAHVGAKLTASAGTWNTSGLTYGYQWLRAGAAVSGATSSTYTLTAADYGKAVAVRVTASRTGYVTATATSDATKVAAGTAAKATRTPTVSGTVAVGKRLSAKVGTWNASGLTYGYQWLRSGKAISGATKSTYTVTTTDVGQKLSIKVSAKRTGYATGTATSTSTKAVPKSKATVSVKLAHTTIKHTAHGKVTVTVKVTGVSKPTGSVVVKYGTKTVKATVKASGKGVVSVTLPTLRAGTYKISVTFTPSGTAAKYGVKGTSSTVHLKST